MAKSERATACIGGDPEFFIAKAGRIIPSCGLLGGTKGEPAVLGPEKYGYKWLEDNVAVELNFPPRHSAPAFVDVVGSALSYAMQRLDVMGYTSIIQPTYTFRASDLAHPKASVFGCDPDFCAYDSNAPSYFKDPSGKARDVDVAAFSNERYCGGHIHLSYKNPGEIPAWVVILLLDVFVGLPSICIDHQGSRRKYYGCAGLYRPKEYGVEYRTLSNWWLNVNNRTMYMAETCLSIARAVEHNPDIISKVYAKIPFSDVQKTINGELEKEAIELHSYIAQMCDSQGLGIDSTFRARYIK